MSKIFLSLAVVFIATLSAQAQGPLSPPKIPPVPLTGEQQNQRRAEAVAKPTAVTPTPATNVVRIPAAIGGRISSGNAAIDGFVSEAAMTHGLDPYLILSVMRHESGFNRNAVSPKGASGLMQLMPATAMRFGVRNIFDVRENILGGAKYLRWLLERFNGDVRLALAAYNAGEGAVEFYGNRIPPFSETQNYVRAIYSRYAGLRSNLAPLPVNTVATPRASETAKETFPSYNQIIVSKSSQRLASAKSGN
ncbi:MAG: lytic transglycosylase domain-containing protein [Acidobacteria bacterium]|nr:lytic transglycosylase domain-containing protein [Acidobacteriota bacterium]